MNIPYYEGSASSLVRALLPIHEIRVPGALEIPAAIRQLTRASSRWDNADGDGDVPAHWDEIHSGNTLFVALGCVIRGETSHYDIVAQESARGLMDLALRDNLCIGNGILTTDTRAQAIERADKEKGNKAAHALEAAAALWRVQKLGRHISSLPEGQ
ncbi:MAG: 6,7-dimethyl-8-ribityllumazine synthase [Alphaproteobacteria bacterium]|nr:6,7-dimethyl-8-ribityllumazine synthase [Alphaproteobacteria bacterium]